MNGHMLPPPPSQLDTSYASIANGGKTSSYKANETEGMKSISLLDHDLIKIEDSSEVVLVKVKEVDTMINMYGVCRKEGFINLKIHYISGLWTWITFPNASACAAFKQNDSLKCIFQTIRPMSKNFVVDERMIWIKIIGLPLRAWGSADYKKVAGLFGKFRFFEVDHESTVGSGKLCISTKQSTKISETVHVIIDGETFAVYVQELASWNVKLDDDTEQEDSINAHVASDGLSANLEQPLDDMEPQKPLSDHIDDQFQEVASDGLFDKLEQSLKEIYPQEHQLNHLDDQNADIASPLVEQCHAENLIPKPHPISVEDPISGNSCPPGFEHLKRKSSHQENTPTRSDTSKCSTSFTSLHNKFKFFKARLKEWHQIQKQQESSRQQEHKKIQIIDNKIEHSLASDFEKEERVQLIQELILGPERALLEQNVSLDEIKQAVWDCGSTKASRPDEFSFLFLKTY
ncbi:hypothetical protein Tco_0550607 [Tanacetum coccineum]